MAQQTPIFHIQPGGETPVSRQIADSVRHAILARRLVPGDALPSVRALAEQLVINPNTVMRAYADLERDGLIAGQQGRGFTVVERRQVFSLEERKRRLAAAARAFAAEAGFLDFSEDEILNQVRAALRGAVPGGSRAQTTREDHGSK